MLRPKALDHLALKVTDMDKTLRFYHQVLGLVRKSTCFTVLILSQPIRTIR
jgi:catechol 2,3-dioxygenase-like lactoylglutathione lyase family enzyme